MIPKKPEIIIKEIAERNDMPISMIDDIISFYYKELSKKLSSLEDIRINVCGLGHFVMKRLSVEKLVKKYENMLNKYDSQTFINYHNKKQAQIKLEKLYHARKKINEFITYKKAFRDGRKTNNNLEEQKTNS